MKHSKLLIAGALAAAAWCSASQAQSVIYDVQYVDYGAGSTGSTPDLNNTAHYPKHPGNAGFATTGYWDNGVWWERSDPVVVDSKGNLNYVNPETARLVYPPDRVYVLPDRPEMAPSGSRIPERAYRR